MVGRTQLVATLWYSNTCRNHYPELLVLGVVTTDAEAPVYNSGILKFLPGFMTRLIQWGHKLSKNSKSVENHIFRGHAALRGLLYY